jgi:peptidoglycan/xylan/chitin deacetylase (PgdA/CDA1 family)
MKITGPLLILLLLLSLPVEAQVDRSSVDLNSRRQSAESSLPRGWLKPEAEPDAFKWSYRQEQAVRRVSASIKLDAQEILELGLGRDSASSALVANAAPLESAPARPDSAKFRLPRSRDVEQSKPPADPEVAQLPEPADALLEAAEPEDATETDEAPAPDEASAAQASETDAAIAAPEIEQEEAEEFVPKYDFRIKPKPGKPAPASDPAVVQPEAEDNVTPEPAQDAPAALADTSALIDQALSKLNEQNSEEQAETGFIPDSAAQRSNPRRELLPEPAQGQVSRLGSQPAPLLLPTGLEQPVLPEFAIRSDILKFSRGNSKLRQVALTFDDGPHPHYTSQILAILDFYNAPATFFFVGVQSSKYPQWVQMASQQGHEIASQTYDHFRLPKLPQNEKEYQIDAYQDLVEDLIGERPRFLRPPGGQIDDASLALLKQRGMVCALWDVALNDTGAGKTSDELLKHTLKGVRNGSVILAHDGIQATIDMLPELIEKLREAGYEFVTMSELASGV